MVNIHKPKVGVSVPEPVKAEALLREIQELTDVLDDVSVRMHVLKYHLAQLEAYEIVARAGQPATKGQYTIDDLAGMVSTYFDSPLQMTALFSMFNSGNPVQQRDAVRCVLAAKRAHDGRAAPVARAWQACSSREHSPAQLRADAA